MVSKAWATRSGGMPPPAAPGSPPPPPGSPPSGSPGGAPSGRLPLLWHGAVEADEKRGSDSDSGSKRAGLGRRKVVESRGFSLSSRACWLRETGDSMSWLATSSSSGLLGGGRVLERVDIVWVAIVRMRTSFGVCKYCQISKPEG